MVELYQPEHTEKMLVLIYMPQRILKFIATVLGQLKQKICVEIPKGYVGFIMGRSSLNMKGIICLTGVIDSGYTGELGIALFNSDDDWMGNKKFKKGDRIAQLVVAKLADIDNAVAVDSLEDSERGTGGFGSTGA